MTPGTLDVGLVFNKTFDSFKRMAGPLVGFAALLVLPFSFITTGLQVALQFMKDERHPNLALLGAMVLALLVFSALQGLGMMVYTAVVSRATLEAQEGQPGISFDSLLQGVRNVPLLNLLVAGVLAGLGIGIGTLFCIAPGVYLAVCWAVVTPVVVLEGLSGTEALSRSNQLVEGNRLQVFLVILVFGILGMAIGAMLCCCGPVASLVTAPLGAISTTELYLALRSGESSSTPPAVVPPAEPPVTW